MHIKIHTQLDDESCGPACLHAIYHYYGLDISLDEVTRTIERSLSRGTLSPLLGKHALQRGFQASIYIYNLVIFDPSWFKNNEVENEVLIEKLTAQMRYKNEPYITMESQAFIDFLSLGGRVRTHPLNANLLKKYFNKKHIILQYFLLKNKIKMN